MNKKMLLPITAVVTIAVGIGGYFVLSNNGAETASAKCTTITTVFTLDENTLDEKLTDLYAGTIVESETAEEESYIQKMVEAGEMSGDVEDAQKSNPDGTIDITGATKPSGGDTTTQPSDGGTGPNGVDLDAIRAALGQTDGYSGPTVLVLMKTVVATTG